MPQHLWHEFPHVRMCEACYTVQNHFAGEWTPRVSPICAGDDDDDGARGRSGRGPRPTAPSGAPRVLEVA